MRSSVSPKWSGAGGRRCWPISVERDTQPCGNCDNCLSPPETIDGTVLAQKALSTAYRTGQRFGVGYLVDILHGKADERAIRNAHDRLTVFGIGKDVPAADWRGLFRQLAAAGYLTGDDEGYGTLLLTDRARPLLRGEEPFLMRRPREAEPKKSRTRKEGRSSGNVAADNQPLYQALKALRLKLAVEAKLPPYVICHDTTLVELAEKRPQSEEALAGITGLGTSKIKRYGAAFLSTIGNFKKHPLLDNRLSATVNQTLALHLAGHDAENIASVRSLEIGTVYGHFAEAVEAGLIEARAVIGLEEAEIDEILAAFDDTGAVDSGKLGPAHAALQGQYDYGILKCLLAELA